MRTASQIALLIVGGGSLGFGIAAAIDAGGACRDARARGDAAAAAAACGPRGGSGGVWFTRDFGGGRLATVERVVRGGFGRAGLHFGFGS